MPIGIGHNYTDVEFEFRQDDPAETWIIIHNLDRHPRVIVIDSAGDTVEPDIIYDSRNQVTIEIGAAMAGRAYLS